MDTDPHRKEIRRLSLTSSIVFLLLAGFFTLIVSIRIEGQALLLIGSSLQILLFVPLALAFAFIVRLVHLRLTTNARIPFVSGWLIQVSILILYTGLYIVF
jgi:hypothetical protein